MKTRKTKAEACGKRGKLPAGLYVQVEERLNARWAAAHKERGSRAKPSGLGRNEK